MDAPPAPARLDLAPPPGPWANRLAPAMFGLSLAYLLAVAGVIHRADEAAATHFELRVLALSLALLWPLFAVEAVAGLFGRHPSVRIGPALARTALVLLFPPARLGLIHPGSGLIWLPRLGWQAPGRALVKRIDKATGGIMLVFAALILPLLAVEHAAASAVEASRGLRLTLDVATAAIWVAFAVEFIVKGSVAPAFFRYALARWLDLAVVVLPALEFILSSWAGAAPALRLLRLQKAMSPQALSQMGKVYRMRGVMMKGWQAVLMAGGLARLVGQSPAKRLAALELAIEELEEQLATLRAEADELRRAGSVVGGRPL